MRIAAGVLGGFLVVVNMAGATPVPTGSITYTGTEGPFNSAGVLNAVPNNLALNTTNSASGPTAFTNSVISNGGLPPHQTRHLNDGNYANSRSWIGGATTNVDVGGGNIVSNVNFAGIDLKGSFALTSAGAFAFGSDNGNFLASNGAPNDGNENSSGADTGFYHDRTAGTYYVQYTTAASPNATTPDASWITLGTIALGSSSNDSYRHLYGLTGPITATGLRIIVPSGDRIDEIEVYGVPEPSAMILASLGLLGLIGLAFRRR